MSAIFELNSDSSESEDDVDYLPGTGVSDSSVADEESDEELLFNGASKLKKTKRTITESEDKTSDSPQLSDTSEKKRADDLWKSFLSDVEDETKTAKGVSATTESGTRDPPVPNSKSDDSTKIRSEEIYEFAGEIVAIDERNRNGNERDHDCIKTSDIYNASETHTVTNLQPNKEKGVDFQSNGDEQAGKNSVIPEAKESGATHTRTKLLPNNILGRKRAGLDSIINNLGNKTKKLTTLQKTLYDWQSYKNHEGIEDDLLKHNKGKGGYLERQAFLQRSDFRSYSIERDARLSKRKK